MTLASHHQIFALSVREIIDQSRLENEQPN
jgi:hypothetical protein